MSESKYGGLGRWSQSLKVKDTPHQSHPITLDVPTLEGGMRNRKRTGLILHWSESRLSPRQTQLPTCINPAWNFRSQFIKS